MGMHAFTSSHVVASHGNCRRTGALALVVVGIFCAVTCAAELAEDPDGRAMVQAAQRAIAAYHEGQPRSDGALRVVYFHPNDRDALSGYAERLDRVVTNISDYYRDGLQRLGFRNDGLPLERHAGRLVLHVVQGRRSEIRGAAARRGSNR